MMWITTFTERLNTDSCRKSLWCESADRVTTGAGRGTPLLGCCNDGSEQLFGTLGQSAGFRNARLRIASTDVCTGATRVPPAVRSAPAGRRRHDGLRPRQRAARFSHRKPAAKAAGAGAGRTPVRRVFRVSPGTPGEAQTSASCLSCRRMHAQPASLCDLPAAEALHDTDAAAAGWDKRMLWCRGIFTVRCASSSTLRTQLSGLHLLRR